MYADLDDQSRMSDLFHKRLTGNESDSPEFEAWIFDEIGRLWTPEHAQRVAGLAKTAGKSLRDTVLGLPEMQAKITIDNLTAAARAPKN
jgi:hypothetical protein